MINQNLGELLQDKVTLDIEGIDRLYLNAYQPLADGWWRVIFLQAASWCGGCIHHIDGAYESGLCCRHSSIFQAQ